MTTLLEAARLVRSRITAVAPNVFDMESVDPDNLLGACGIASYTLSKVLRRAGVKCDLVMGRFWSSSIRDRGDHCWVYVESLDLIVDITATQFPDMSSEVHVTSGDDFRYKGELHNRKAMNDLKEWEGQSHLCYQDVLDRIIEDSVIQLFQSGFISYEATRAA